MQGVSLGFNSVCPFPSKHAFTISCRSTTNLDMGRKTNFYKVLSLDSEAVGADEIKKAYRRMARQCHPDVCPPSRKEESTRMFLELHHAYETLSDPMSRMMYDNDLRMNGKERVLRSELSVEAWEVQLEILRERSGQRKRERSQRA